MQFIISEEEQGERIDKYLTDKCPECSRAFLQKLIKENHVTINDKICKSNAKVSTGDVILLSMPEPEPLEIPAEDLKLDILYEDDDIILINKPKGMVVHPAAGHYSGTVVNGLLYHCRDSLSGINGVLRPGIVHRIDKDTTGVIVACKNDAAHNHLAEQFKEHSITRKYKALVYNTFAEDNGTVEGNLARKPSDRKKMAIVREGGKPAITHYHVLERLRGKYAYIECQLETGRTHQIRVHMASINHPLLGDNVYGFAKSKFKLKGQALHAETLGFIHPTTGAYMEFRAPLPEYFEALLNQLRN